MRLGTDYIDLHIIKRSQSALSTGHILGTALWAKRQPNGSPDEIKTRILNDFQKAGQTGGLTVTTAGSLAAGTGIGRMRWMMQVIQEHCRYD